MANQPGSHPQTALSDRPRQRELIGIVGGLGPWAHLELERQLLAAAHRLLAPRCEQELPSWVLSSIPATPDRTAAIADPGAPDPWPFLLESVRRLEGGHADFIVIACNTAHTFLSRLRQTARVPILDMIDETARALAVAGSGRRVALLATTGTLRTALYQQALARHGLEGLTPFETRAGAALQDQVMAAIYGSAAADSPFAAGGIKTRGVFVEARRALHDAAAMLVEQLDAEVIVAGCTEISLALNGARVHGVPVVDPLVVVAEVAVRRAYGLAPG